MNILNCNTDKNTQSFYEFIKGEKCSLFYLQKEGFRYTNRYWRIYSNPRLKSLSSVLTEPSLSSLREKWNIFANENNLSGYIDVASVSDSLNRELSFPYKKINEVLEYRGESKELQQEIIIKDGFVDSYRTLKLLFI